MSDWFTYLDVKTTIGRKQVVYSVRDSLVKLWDSVRFVRLEVYLVIQGNEGALESDQDQ